MKALFLDYYYESFLDNFHKAHSDLAVMDLNSYRELLMKQRLCGSDSLTHHFRQHGWEAEEIITNDPVFLQKMAQGLNTQAWILPVLPAKFLNRYLGWDSRFQILKKGALNQQKCTSHLCRSDGSGSMWGPKNKGPLYFFVARPHGGQSPRGRY